MPQRDTSHARFRCHLRLKKSAHSFNTFEANFSNFLRTDKSTIKSKFLVKQYEERDIPFMAIAQFLGNGLFPADGTLPTRKRPTALR